MRILTAAILLAAAATSTAAFAQARLTDAQFISAAHCQGLAGDNAGSLDAVVKANEHGRVGIVLDRADTARRDAARRARKATGEGGKAEIARELAGACAAFGG